MMLHRVLPNGTKIWCPVFLAHERGVCFHEDLIRSELKKEKGGVTLFYAVFSPWYWSSKYWVSEKKLGEEQFSFPCVCKGLIPEKWTYFRVIGKGSEFLLPDFRIVEAFAGPESEVVRRHYDYNRLPHTKIPEI
ncbi:MAG: hypothetical protein Q8Q95_01365 [bacterium]|nr:hypothetical protein [bacterium]